MMGVRYVVRQFRVAVAVGLVAVGLCWVGAAGASTRECQSWGAQPPDNGSFANWLQGVTATSACNAWAVGSYDDGTTDQTLIEHWNGTTWKIQPAPNPGGLTSYGELYGVAATSPTDAWAVGYYADSAGPYQTLIEHWNGKAWKVAPSPSPGGSGVSSELYGVAVASSTDAWAVGEAQGHKGLIEHWNGKAWKVESSPTLDRFRHTNGRFAARPLAGLNGVVAASSNDAWAVGFRSTGTADQTLIEHFNGKAWKVQTSPNPGGSSNYNALSGVAATSSTNAWAVGGYYNGTTNLTLVERWNGKSWKHQKSPNPKANDELEGVAATSSSNAWAVGDYGGLRADPSIIERWNGKAWTVEAGPKSPDNYLAGVAAVSPSDAWAVGSYEPGSTEDAFAIHCC
jgi:hypothetical protein